MHAENEYFCIGGRGEDLARGLKPVQPGHGDIKNSQVRLEIRSHANRFIAILCFADNHPIAVTMKYPANAATNEFVVVGDQQPKSLISFGHESARSHALLYRSRSTQSGAARQPASPVPPC